MALSKPPGAEIEALLEKSLDYTTHLNRPAERQVYAGHSFKTRLVLFLSEPDQHDSLVPALNALVGQFVFSSVKEYVLLQALLNDITYEE